MRSGMQSWRSTEVQIPQALPGPTESGWTAESAILGEDDEMSSEVAPSALCICDTTFLLGVVGVVKHVYALY